MCLEPEFFDEREELRLKYEVQGEIELGIFLKKLSPLIITESDLFKMRILQKKKYSSTADLSDYKVSKLGSEYLNEREEYDLVLVKPNKREALLKKLLSSC